MAGLIVARSKREADLIRQKFDLSKSRWHYVSSVRTLERFDQPLVLRSTLAFFHSEFREIMVLLHVQRAVVVDINMNELERVQT